MVIACHNMFILYSMWFITSIVMFIHNTHILIIFTIFDHQATGGRSFLLGPNQVGKDTNTVTDTRRVAIWGWSYGGFATALTLEQGGINPALL